MMVLVDTGSLTETVKVTATGCATSVPVAAGFTKSHSGGAAFGQLAVASTLAVVGGAQLPNNPGRGL